MNTTQIIIDIWKSSGDSYADLWMFYILIVSGALGFAFSNRLGKADVWARWCLVAILSFFMGANLYWLWNNMEIYNASVDQLRIISERNTTNENLEKVLEEIERLPDYLIVALHIILDVCALIILGRACIQPRCRDPLEQD